MNPQPMGPSGQTPPVPRPRPVPTVSPEEERFRQYFLSVSPTFDVQSAWRSDVKRRFKEMSAAGIRELFWRLPEVRQAMKTVQYQRSSGIPSELLFDQQPLEQNVRIVSFVHHRIKSYSQ